MLEKNPEKTSMLWESENYNFESKIVAQNLNDVNKSNYINRKSLIKTIKLSHKRNYPVRTNNILWIIG